MNKDQLLDAIGMVDEQKIRDAAMIKRTKRISGILAAVVTAVAMVLLLAAGGVVYLFRETTVAYTLDQLAWDIDRADTVTVYPAKAGPDSVCYTIDTPSTVNESLRFEEWRVADLHATDDRAEVLALRVGRTSLTFYDGGMVRVEKHDWDRYVGVYTVPENLWRDVQALLAK